MKILNIKYFKELHIKISVLSQRYPLPSLICNIYTVKTSAIPGFDEKFDVDGNGTIDNADNMITAMIDKNGAKTSIKYDKAGNKAKEILPENYDAVTDDGLGTTYVYDTMNRVIMIKDAKGTVVQKNIYDINGQIVKVIDAKGYASSSTDDGRYGIEYNYDIGKRIVSIITPESKAKGKTSKRFEYDAAGNISSTTDGEDNKTTYERDMWGRATKITDAKGTVTSYIYDYAGNITQTVDGNGNKTTYEYNSINKLSKITDAHGKSIEYKYDLQGRLKLEVDRKGQNINYEFNSDVNLTQRSISGTNDFEKYLYNLNGNLGAAINKSYVDEFTYTPDNLTKKISRNGETYIEYEYNKNGDVTKVSDTKGKSTAYEYDTLGRLEKVKNGNNILTTYRYGVDGAIEKIDYATGVKAEYIYDLDKNITKLENKNPQGEAISTFEYTYDNNGNIVSRTENGKNTISTYDSMNRIITDGDTAYTYDNAGNRVAKSDGSDITTYKYDELNRMTERTANGIISSYNYNDNGNLLTETANGKVNTYTYDVFNRLTGVEKSDGSWMQNTYDPEGLRSGIIENSISREFTFDRGSVISEYNASGNLMSRNIRGIGLVGLEDGIGRLDYYLQNAHGDVTEIVDANGGIQNQYSYDAFGNVLSSQEKLQNRFMYSGEQFDRITEQYYLRARYYEPETGRFTQEDTYRGDGLNLYTYVQNNPLRFVDPSGHATKCPDKEKGNSNSTIDSFIFLPQLYDWVNEKLGEFAEWSESEDFKQAQSMAKMFLKLQKNPLKPSDEGYAQALLVETLRQQQIMEDAMNVAMCSTSSVSKGSLIAENALKGKLFEKAGLELLGVTKNTQKIGGRIADVLIKEASNLTIIEFKNVKKLSKSSQLSTFITQSKKNFNLIVNDTTEISKPLMEQINIAGGHIYKMVKDELIRIN